MAARSQTITKYRHRKASMLTSSYTFRSLQQQQQQHQRLLPPCDANSVALGANSRQHGKISRQRRVLSHDCYGTKPWAAEAECKLLGGEVNSD
ncbi:AGAP000442-PA-like protein [Anopheles sinensis]|uniref:AGAP000442-PA-like protein n=1 Tax=Anopheles sinensis TaxID=74873 RepID=A0A084VX62_ANOSI|nr:AGAP000442-PA-like protein [Anopheles sinensis]